MKRVFSLPILFLLGSCQSMHSNDPSSLYFNIPEGSTLILNKDLPIPKGQTHVVIQDGKLTTEKDRDDYTVSCRLDLKEFGPRTIKPETFKIIRVEDGREWFSKPSTMRFYTEVYLKSDKGTDVIALNCEKLGDRFDSNFSVTEMEENVTGYFSFAFP